MREIAFVEQALDLPPAARVLRDQAAYAHLLEVICGLDSPMVGETEVLHQFKTFAATLAPELGPWREIAQLLLADARAVRARHLVGLGSRSYGSAVRRYVAGCRRVALLGTGMLAAEILPYLVDEKRTIDLWGRRDGCSLTGDGVNYRRVDGPECAWVEEPAVVVIAAPARADDIARLAARYSRPVAVIDLRAEGPHDPLPAIAPITTLADVFADVERATRITDVRVTAARHDIRGCANAFANRAKLNPSGWHDLCA